MISDSPHYNMWALYSVCVHVGGGAVSGPHFVLNVQDEKQLF